VDGERFAGSTDLRCILTQSYIHSFVRNNATAVQTCNTTASLVV
jgi:hypothetical protein